MRGLTTPLGLNTGRGLLRGLTGGLFPRGLDPDVEEEEEGEEGREERPERAGRTGGAGRGGVFEEALPRGLPPLRDPVSEEKSGGGAVETLRATEATA